MDIQNTFSDIRSCFLDIQNNYFGYPKTGINVNRACHRRGRFDTDEDSMFVFLNDVGHYVEV